MNINIGPGVTLEAQMVMTGRGCVIGQSGSGKSYLLGVLVEELCKNKLPFVLVDTEGEYSTLRQAFQVITIGREHADFGADVDYGKVFEQSLADGIPVVIDVSAEIDKRGYVHGALQKLYALEEKVRKPCLVILEEADKFAPQVVHPEPNIVEEISVRGRKRGLGMIVATQRPANISKNVLAQCSYGFIGKLSLESDIKAVSILFDDKKILAAIPGLQHGAFLSFGARMRGEVMARKRTLESTGRTPSVEDAAYKKVEFEKAIEGIKGELAKMGGSSGQEAMRGAEMARRPKRMEARVLAYTMTLDDARTYAQKALKKRFVFFGPETEAVESVAQKYIEAWLWRIRSPTGRRNEYQEGYLVTRSQEVMLQSPAISFVKAGPDRPVALDRYETKVLAYVSLNRQSDLAQIAARTGLREETAGKILGKLKRTGLVEETAGKHSAHSYAAYLQKAEPKTTVIDIDTGKVASYASQRVQANAERLIGDLYPGADFKIVGSVYLPVYQITLRRGSVVRVFAIEAVSGNEIKLG